MTREPGEGKEQIGRQRHWLSARRPWLWCGVGVLLYAAAGFLLTPWLLERTLTATLSQRLALDARVAQIRFNPFTFTLEAEGLVITEAGGAPFASLSGLLVNFELSSLFRWAISFDEVHLTKPQLAIELNPGSNSLARLGDRWRESASAAAQEILPESSDDGELPRLYIGDLRLISGRLGFADKRRPDPFETDVGPIDLAIRDLSTLPDASSAQEVRISGEGGTEIAWTGNLSLNPLRSDGRVTLKGSYSPVLYRYLQDQLPFALDQGEVDASLHYQVRIGPRGELQLALEDIGGTLLGLALTEHDGTPLAQLGRYEIVNGSLLWPQQQVRIDAVRFSDVTLNVVRRENGSINLMPTSTPPSSEQLSTDESSTDGAADIEPESTEVADADSAAAPWQIDLGRLELGVSRLVFRDEKFSDNEIQASVDVVVTDITNQPQQSIKLDARVALASGGELRTQGALTVLPDIMTRLDITLTDLNLAPAQPYLSEFAHILIRSGTIGLSGTLNATPDAPMSYRGDFNLDNLELNDEIEQETLFSLKKLQIDELKLTTAGAELSRVTLDRPYARIEIERDGSTNIQRVMVVQAAEAETDTSVAVVPKAASIPSSEAASAMPFALAIGEIAVTDASAKFTDLALPLPFEADILSFGGQISALSTTSSAPAELDFEGRVNEWGLVTVSGALRPWAPRELTRIDVAFRNVDLPRTSAYTIKFAGRPIAAGRSDLDLTYALQNGEVEGRNRLVISDLELGAPVEQPGAMKLPLDLAVALLKNRDGKIDLDTPVRGSLDDPQFSYGDAVLGVFGNLIGKLVASPFRLLGSLVGIQSDDFGAVTFASGRSRLSPPDEEQLLHLAEALDKRPQLKIAVPGVLAEPADRRALARAELERQIEERLTASSSDQSASTADTDLLSKRRARILEQLYDEAGLVPDRKSLRSEFVKIDDQGTETLDELAFSAALQNRLLSATQVNPEQLSALADARAQAVVQALTAAAVAAERIRIAPTRTIKSDNSAELTLEIRAR